jgi:phage shock protein E
MVYSMLGKILSKIGFGSSVDYKDLVKQGAVIVDVRTKGEYASGHIKGSINLPLDAISSNLKKLDKNKVIITCCASGMRSGAAKGILKSNGFSNVHNGGGWRSLQAKI